MPPVMIQSVPLWTRRLATEYPSKAESVRHLCLRDNPMKRVAGLQQPARPKSYQSENSKLSGNG